MPSAGFELAFEASERQQTHALDREAAGIGPVLGLLLQTHRMSGGTEG